MKLTQSQIIIKLLEEKNDWIYSWELIKVSTKWGWLGSSADRQARSLREKGIIEEKREGKYSMYRLKPLPVIRTVSDIMKQPRLLKC